MVTFKTESCVGCRSCELACSYHHKRIFRPSISSIKILDRPKDLGFAIQLYSETEGGRIACDGCKGLDEPLCMKYCSPLMRNELAEILRKFSGSRSNLY